jgi:hypothetical protein
MPHEDRPQHEPGSAGPSDELVLAAVERAERHQPRDTPGVPAWTILEHLAIARRSVAARHVRERLQALDEAGWLARSRRHSVPTWTLTDAGLAHLRRRADADADALLPESPQHLGWRAARAVAAQELERFREGARERLARAATALDAEPPPHSDAWLELAEELQRACRRLASASYCLYEWAEPDDARADLDTHVEPGDEQLEAAERAVRRARRAGRRNTRLWAERRDC